MKKPHKKRRKHMNSLGGLGVVEFEGSIMIGSFEDSDTVEDEVSRH